MRMSPYSDAEFYQRYYDAQRGGGLPVFAGASVQRGHGLGNVIRGLFNSVVPIFKTVGKTVGKQALQTGLQIAGDIAGGENLKESAKRRTREAGRSLLNKAVHHFEHPRKKGIKRKASGRTISRARGRRANSSKRDIFSG